MIPSRADALPEETPATDGAAAALLKRRPVRRPSKPDAVLAAAVDLARQGLLQVVPADQVGEHVTSYPEAERLTTHRFEAFVPGYGGWQWFVTLTRVPRGKEATISEVGLLPSEHALLAPEWLPWSERVRPEDHDDAAEAGQAADGQVQTGAGSPEAESALTGAGSDETMSDETMSEGTGPDAAGSDEADPESTDATSAGSNPADSAGVGFTGTDAGSTDAGPADAGPADPAPAETSQPATVRKRTRRVASAPAGDPFGSPFGNTPPGRDD